MELVGCAASVSQLVVYLHSSAVSLQRLYTRLVHGHSSYRDEATNIGLLLNTLRRLSDHHVDDNSPVLPVLISISGIACQVLHLLQPKRSFGINWGPITSQDKIVSAFEALNKKRDLLHFHISQTHQEALVDLRQTIQSSRETTSSLKESAKGAMSPNSNKTNTVPMASQTPAARITLRMSQFDIGGHNSMFNGPGQDSADVIMTRFTVNRTNSMFNTREFTVAEPPNPAAAHADTASTNTTAEPDIQEPSPALQPQQAASESRQTTGSQARPLSGPGRQVDRSGSGS